MILKIPCGKYVKKLDVDVVILPEGKYAFYADYDKDLIEELRAMEGSKWNPESRNWTADISPHNNFTIKYLMGEKIERYHKPITQIYNKKNNELAHQIEGINFALIRRQCMLNFEMGLGKTYTTLQIIQQAKALGKTDWWLVAPYGAQKTWERELVKWKIGFKFSVVSTYESLHKLGGVSIPHGIIFDESIRIANPNSQRSKTAKDICQKIREAADDNFIILLSGAPAPKAPTQWWHQMECICPGWIKEGDLFKFQKRYAIIEPKEGEYGTYNDIVGWKTDEVEKLGKRIAPLVLTKKKKDCLDFPDKIFEQINCQQEEDAVRISKFIIDNSINGLDALNSLRQLSDGFKYTKDIEKEYCTHCRDGVKEKVIINDSTTHCIECEFCKGLGYKIRKVNYTEYDESCKKTEVVRELLDLYDTSNGGNGRLVIYAVYHASIDKLVSVVEACDWQCGKIDGRGWSDPEALDNFEDDSINNYVIIAHPGSVHGLNLQRTNTLVYYSNDFNPDYRRQSLERADRLGTEKTVGTKIIDIINLPVDRLILDRINLGLGLQDITMEEIKRYYA